MNKTYTLTSRQAAEIAGITVHEVNKKALKGEITRVRKNKENPKSIWLYSEDELRDIDAIDSLNRLEKEHKVVSVTRTPQVVNNTFITTTKTRPWYSLLKFWK
jgi:hypothetical protein